VGDAPLPVPRGAPVLTGRKAAVVVTSPWAEFTPEAANDDCRADLADSASVTGQMV